MKMLVKWLLAIALFAFAEGQGYGTRSYQQRASQRAPQRAQVEYPREPISGYRHQNPKQYYGQFYGRQFGQKHSVGRFSHNNQGKSNGYRGNNYQRGYGTAGLQRSSGKSVQAGQTNQNQYYKPTNQLQSSTYTNQLQRVNTNYNRQNAHGKQQTYHNQRQQQGNAGYGQNNYGLANSYGQNNAYNTNAYATQGRTFPQQRNNYGQGQRDVSKSQPAPSFIENGHNLQNAGNFFDSFKDHNAGLRSDGFGQFKALSDRRMHAYGSSDENKPIEVEAFEKFAQTLPYDLDSVDGMGIF